MTYGEYKGKTYESYHGSAFDRGSADSYYGRPKRPHKGGSGGTHPQTGKPLGFEPDYNLTPEEVEAYHAGYDDNEEQGNKKHWG